MISDLQTGHFNCKKPLAVPILNARILLHFWQRTAALGALSLSVDMTMLLLSAVALLGLGNFFPVNLTAPSDRQVQFWTLEETQPSPVIHFKNVPKFTSKVGGKFVSLLF